MDQMRKEFELRFPVPSGVAWNKELKQYVLFHRKQCSLASHSAYLMKWTVWRASRAALVVRLPDCFETLGSCSEAAEIAVDCCSDAIEEAGITVIGRSESLK